ncbi:SMP-30/gluconolactonase/LRE family protein [Cronobacter turicensis]|uniref:SMP-30/gluconolactonase/LRE family protein n=3 Tax=Cronobacter turicensis TaxID=413502 RepID=UPI00192A397E|nr:SMP-30/gluconolactonase/LRE family protein [Cronobacter turicensis]MEB8539025.1 SMP-30/gluconolactonase/LRE family protein [Cronobacter sakazakii]
MTYFLGDPASIGAWRARLGETPVWCDRSASLLWVDILAGKLLRYWPSTQRLTIRDMPRFTSAVLLTTRSDHFLVVSQTGIGVYDYARARMSSLLPWPESETHTRPNDAAIAPDGALWFSTMEPQAAQAIGRWYRLEPGATAPQLLLARQWVPNTMVWYEDAQWFADSLRHRFYRAAFRPPEFTLLQEYEVEGIADGSALSMDGHLINARWGAGKLVCHALRAGTMREEESFALPVRQPSSCAFGGDTLSDLYITSARDGLTHPGPLDGALLILKTTLTGQPENRFRL